MGGDLSTRLAGVAGSCIAAQVRILGRAVSSLYEEALRPHGLKISQMNLLVAIAVMPTPRARDLAATLCLEKSTVSRNLLRLVERGWVVEEVEEDARSRRLSLSSAGASLLQRVLPDWERAQERVVAAIGKEGATQIAALARKLRGRAC